ncbi:MAG: TRAP transporter small permease [Desulfitobacteriaceae bacterium]
MDFIIRKLSGAAHTLAGIILGVMFLSIVANVIARNLGFSMIWVEELSGYGAVWATYLGIGFALREERHVRVDMLTRKLSQRGQELMRFLGDLICVVFSVLITWKGFYLIWSSYISGRHTPFVEIPIYLLQIVLPVGMILFGLEALVDAVKTRQRLKI